MWPSTFTPYGVQSATNWRGGKGDVLREFVDAAKRWGIKICYCACGRAYVSMILPSCFAA